MKPIFTIHAGEFLVGCEIEKLFKKLNVWVPTKDTGIDLLVSNAGNTKTVSLQVKFSRDYLATNAKDSSILNGLRAGGWWTPTRQKIKESKAQYWVFVLVGFANRSTDFIVIKPGDLLKRLDAIYGKKVQKFNIYFWVTKGNKCYETRNLDKLDKLKIANEKFNNKNYDFTAHLEKLKNWTPLKVLNG